MLLLVRKIKYMESLCKETTFKNTDDNNNNNDNNIMSYGNYNYNDDGDNVENDDNYGGYDNEFDLLLSDKKAELANKDPDEIHL
jgi:hypothetical protein